MEDNCSNNNAMDEEANSNETTLLSVFYFTILLTFLHHKLFGFHRCVFGHVTAAILRVRVSVLSVFRQLGAYYVPRAYHMDTLPFWRFHRLLHPYLGGRIHPSSTSKKKN
jgi:hypothetical protein